MRVGIRAVMVSAVPLLLVSSALGAQRAISPGLAATLPAFNADGRQATLTLEVGTRRFPLRFRTDFSISEGDGRGPAYFGGGSVLVPFLNRPLTPYFVGGAAFGLNGTFGGVRAYTGGIRVGGGLRYRIDNRVLFLESARQYSDAGGTRLTLGVQF